MKKEIRGFYKLDEIDNKANIGFPSGNRTTDLGFQVQHSPFYTNVTFVCNTATLGSLYSHALSIDFNLIIKDEKIKWCMNRSLKIS